MPFSWARVFECIVEVSLTELLGFFVTTLRLSCLLNFMLFWFSFYVISINSLNDDL